MQKILRKDLLIPKGTVFQDAPRRMEIAKGHVEYIVELNADCSGILILYPPDAEEWFE